MIRAESWSIWRSVTDGATTISDVAVLADQAALFGLVVPVGAGQLLAPPVLTMVSAFSRWVMATALPTRTTGDLIAGMWLLIQLLGGVPKTLVRDDEAGIGQHQRLTLGAALTQAPHDAQLVHRRAQPRRTSPPIVV